MDETVGPTIPSPTMMPRGGMVMKERTSSMTPLALDRPLFHARYHSTDRDSQTEAWGMRFKTMLIRWCDFNIKSIT